MRHARKTPQNSNPRASTLMPEEESRALVERLDASPEVPLVAKRRASGVELRVGIVLWPGFPLLSLAGLCDGLRHAADVGDQSRQMRCSWAVIGNTSEPTTSSCGVGVPADLPLTADLDFDYIAVIGGLLSRMSDADARLPVFLHHVAALKVPLMGICTGSFVLAKLGLLEGHTACVHPFHVDDWKKLHPELAYRSHAHYSFSQDRVTCAGGISIIELVAELVRLHCGVDRAAKVVHQMTVKATNPSTHITRRHALGYDSIDHEKLRQAVVLMEKNITTPLEIAVIAKLVESSNRQLERVFQAETGCSPSEYYRNSRLKYAKWLLTTTDLPIVTIAYESGFSDASHFIRHFQQLYGTAPGRLRKALQATQAGV